MYNWKYSPAVEVKNKVSYRQKLLKSNDAASSAFPLVDLRALIAYSLVHPSPIKFKTVSSGNELIFASINYWFYWGY